MARANLATFFVLVTVCVVLAEECSDEKCRSSNNEIEHLAVTQEVVTHTPSTVDRPKSMNMLAEDTDHVFRPTPLPSSDPLSNTESSMKSNISMEEPKGRALNFTMDEHSTGNILSNSTDHHHHDDFDLSDVTISDDEDIDMLKSKILAPKMEAKNVSLGTNVCEKGGLTYENGEKLENDCDSICTCRNGKMDCEERCPKPFFRRGKKIDDPLCIAKEADDPCCSVLVCSGDTETEPLEICTYGEKVYNRGEIFNKDCSSVCTCEAGGKSSCKPRCPVPQKTTDRCVEVPDPNDACCKTVLCDVTLEDNEPEKEDDKSSRKLLSAKYINATTILLKFDSKIDENESYPVVEISDDQNSWQNYKILPGGYIRAKDSARYVKLENSRDIITIQNQEMAEKTPDKFREGCQYKAKHFKIGEEYNDECSSLCVCEKTGMKCLKIQCPTYFGIDVLDSNCVEWETIPPNFKASPPNCCPESIRCKNNGSCTYEGKMYKNWDQLPINITGCEKRCYCEMGKVECQTTCPPVTAFPPPNLPCAPNLASVGHIPEDDCCKYWVCNSPNSIPATGHNKTLIDSEGQSTKNSTTNTYYGPYAPKVTTKIVGPLAVYENEGSNESTGNDTLGAVHKPKISPLENPFYHKDMPYHKSKGSKDKTTNYIGPLNPENKVTNKKGTVFVTPPPIEQSTLQVNNHIPTDTKPKLPYPRPPQNPIKSEIEIHGHGNPDDLLQFINQHPEISNYPSGSVLEIHNLPPTQKPLLPQGAKSQIHLVPYLIPQNAAGEQTRNDLPPGFSLEQLLNEFHKNTQPHSNIHLPFLPNLPSFPGNNGPVLLPQPSGSIVSNKLNSTYSDTGSSMFPGPFPGFQQPQDTVTVYTLEAIDAHTVRLAFMVPRVIVGLHGRVEVRYTHTKGDDDIDSWMLQIFAPPSDLIATPSLEFDLLDLKADTEYKIKITITLRDVDNTHSSRIYKIKTPKEIISTTLPPLIPIEPDLAITDINATWVTVIWRKFTEYELQFIDGVQLRFKEIDGKIYAATPLIHRAVMSYTLENLKPNTKYEIGIFFIPFPGQLTELHAENMLHFTTANLIDTYGFNVTLEVTQVKSQSVEITWNGVPYPEDKYVNIYRAIYQSDSGKEDHNTFKIAKRDSPTKTVIMDLKPGTRYRIWLEVYLTNGKIKTSNVQDFITKPRLAPVLGASSQQDKLSRAQHLETKGDYYGPLVIVAILAAIAILSTLVLLLIIVRRHNQNKAAITPPTTRVSQSAYDNPTYKVEIQQETMGL